MCVVSFAPYCTSSYSIKVLNRELPSGMATPFLSNLKFPPFLASFKIQNCVNWNFAL